MTAQVASDSTTTQLLQLRNNLILHQALYAAAKLGVADLLDGGQKTTAELAVDLKVNEEALYRTLRALASQGIFEESARRTFRNSQLSRSLRTGVPGSVRALFIFLGTEFFYRSLGEILYSIETGKPGMAKIVGMSEWEYLHQHPDLAQIFDDAMTNNSELMGAAIAAAYNFGEWESLMDVGGGNGALLSHLLGAHPKLRGVLADLPPVLERARQRKSLEGELATRATMQACDFFREIPSGYRAYLMKSVIHDWDDEQARQILVNCRKVVPPDGALLLVELTLREGNVAQAAKLIDLIMLVLTGGKERTIEEYDALLSSAGFRLNRVVPTSVEFSVIEAIPAPRIRSRKSASESETVAHSSQDTVPLNHFPQRRCIPKKQKSTAIESSGSTTSRSGGSLRFSPTKRRPASNGRKPSPS